MRRSLSDSYDDAWIVILLLADAVLLTVTDFRLAWRPEIAILVAAGVLAAIAFIYTRLRDAPRLASLAATGCRLVLFTDAAAVLDYMLTGLVRLPLWDAKFAAADRVAGLDWLGMYRWINTHKTAFMLGKAAYYGLGPELILLLLWLELSGRTSRAQALWRRFMVTASVTIAVGLVVPAIGAFTHFDLPIAKVTAYALQFQALREGSMRLIDLGNVQGIVIFPSFHACLAVICAASVRGRWAVPVWGFDAVVIAASPPVGGHYFVDIAAGVALAGLAVAVVRSGGAKATQDLSTRPARE